MTITELINILKEYPEDANVKINASMADPEI